MAASPRRKRFLECDCQISETSFLLRTSRQRWWSSKRVGQMKFHPSHHHPIRTLRHRDSRDIRNPKHPFKTQLANCETFPGCRHDVPKFLQRYLGIRPLTSFTSTLSSRTKAYTDSQLIAAKYKISPPLPQRILRQTFPPSSRVTHPYNILGSHHHASLPHSSIPHHNGPNLRSSICTT